MTTYRDLEEYPYTGCSLEPCQARAECIYEDQPACLDCADLMLERAELAGTNRALVNLLPALRDR